MAEVKAYDYKWFDEIGGNEALQEIGELREQASGLTKRARDASQVCSCNLLSMVTDDGICKVCKLPRP